MPRPNILFLLSDEHSFRFFSHLKREDGGEPVATPNLDRVAAQATTFSNAYCQMPLCSPSRLCLLSGREVRGAGAWDNESILGPDLITLPAVMRGAGYATCLVGKMHLGGNRQFVGFEHRPYGDLTGGTGHQGQEIPDGYAGTKFRWRVEKTGILDYPESALQEQVVAQETVAWIREHGAHAPKTPWFVCASFSRPHFPLTAPKRWFDHYWPDRVTEPMAPAAGDSFMHPMCVNMREGFEVGDITDEQRQRMRAGYFACVSYLDEIIGDLLTRLKLSGDLSDTIIVYASDHGEMAGEHGSWWKHSFYEASARVPLMISLPEHRDGSLQSLRLETPVSLIDLFPTLCGLVGVKTPDGLDGRDLSQSILSGTEPPARPVVCDNLNSRWGVGTEFRMVRSGDFKYVAFRDGSELMFNLREDPNEQKDLSKGNPTGETKAALEELREFVASTMDFEEATVERIKSQERLARDFPTIQVPSQGNLYHLQDGRIINGEDVIYNPTVVAKSARELFGHDWLAENMPSDSNGQGAPVPSRKKAN